MEFTRVFKRAVFFYTGSCDIASRATAFGQLEQLGPVVILPIKLRLFVGRINDELVDNEFSHYSTPRIRRLSIPRSSTILTAMRLFGPGVNVRDSVPR